MSQSSSPLLQHMYARFRAAFGQPTTMLELDSQWTLRPDTNPLAPAIFLLVNGSYEKPAVWIFDPYDGASNVWRTLLEAETQVDHIIGTIEKRLVAATRSWNSNSHGKHNHDDNADAK